MSIWTGLGSLAGLQVATCNNTLPMLSLVRLVPPPGLLVQGQRHTVDETLTSHHCALWILFVDSYSSRAESHHPRTSHTPVLTFDTQFLPPDSNTGSRPSGCLRRAFVGSELGQVFHVRGRSHGGPLSSLHHSIGSVTAFGRLPSHPAVAGVPG